MTTFSGSFGDSARCEAAHVHSADGLTVAVTGGPVFLAGRELAQPAVELHAAWRAAGGPACLGKLAGRFAVAILDERARRAVLALDPMGIERVAYGVADGRLVFSSSAEQVARALWAEPRLRPQALFDYLLLHMVPAPDTVFEGVQKLRPGTCATFEAGTVRVERYWRPEFARRAAVPETELARELRESLAAGVAACRPDASTGAFLSGGLDSSTVAGMLGAVTATAPRTFSIGFGVDDYNELEYARIAVRHFGANPREYAVTADDIVDAFPRIAGAFDEPFGNSSAVPTYFCAKLAAEAGITHLLAGDGGDEIFGGNERYARQQIFEAYRRVPSPLRTGVIEPLTRLIPKELPIGPVRKIRSYVDQARIPMPERLESWNFMYRTDLGAMLQPEFARDIDTRAPLARMAEVYRDAPSDELLHRMLWFDWQYTLSDNDLRKVGRACELAGVRVSYPMLDARVVDLSLRVPARTKMLGLELRSFYKQAMRDFLPAEIIAKKKHGFGLPFGQWLKTHARLRELVESLLGTFKSRGIVRPEFVDDVLAQHREGHASYFGYAIWDLAMLEAWLQAHAPRYSAG